MTAEEFIKGKLKSNSDVIICSLAEAKSVLIEFADYHRKLALKSASEDAKLCWKNESHPKGYPYFAWNSNGEERNCDLATHIDRDDILNSYPKENIK